jgi:hypothetical protein
VEGGAALYGTKSSSFLDMKTTAPLEVIGRMTLVGWCPRLVIHATTMLLFKAPRRCVWSIAASNAP